MSENRSKKLKLSVENKEKMSRIKELYGYHNDNYKALMQISRFPDKTLFIKEVFNNNFKKILITTPLNFNQNTYMRLLKKFVKIPVDTNGLVTNPENSRNYQFFNNNNFPIYKDQEFFKQNFSKYPVIQVNLAFTSITPITLIFFNCIISTFRSILHRSFQKHSYLLKSNKLTAEEINQFKKYHNENLYFILCKTDIVEGFEFLSKCLYKHFDQKKVFLLIKNYDSLINQITLNRWFDKVYHFHELYSQILSNTLNSKYIERAVIAGVHYYDIFGSSENDNIGKYLFLEDHPFTKFTGLTESELNNFLAGCQVDEETKELYKQYYGGYVCVKAMKLFPIIFSLQFYLLLHLEKPIIRYVMEKLSSGQSFVIEILHKIEVQHIIELRKMCLNSDIIPFQKPDLLLNYFMHHGYLTYENKIDINCFKVKLVNEGFMETWKDILCIHYDTKYDIMKLEEIFYKEYYDSDMEVEDFGSQIRHYENENLSNVNSYLEDCADIFDKISPTSENNIFNDFIIKFAEKLRQLNVDTEDEYQNLMFDILCKTKFLIGQDGLTFTDGKPDLIFFKENFGIIVKVTYNKSAEIALNQIIEKYGNTFNEKYCLENIKEMIYLGLNTNNKETANINVFVSKAKTS